jgi:NAD(P)-dependent dehydrogenase (short-subunit alcohol dehydrogenase family)
MTASFQPARVLDFHGKTAVVTGGGNGIGQGVALALALAGAKVAVFDHDGQAAQATCERIQAQGGSAWPYTVDVTQESQVEAAMQSFHDSCGHIDILVNNAGIAIRRPTLELSLADWQKVLDVNLTGVFICARAAARFMVPQQSGCMVNTASIMGLSGGRFVPQYFLPVDQGGRGQFDACLGRGVGERQGPCECDCPHLGAHRLHQAFVGARKFGPAH